MRCYVLFYEANLNKIRGSTSVFIFSQENSQKIKKIKTMFIKDKQSYLIDCYELDKNTKTIILNEFFRIAKIKIGKDIYWFLVDKLDNRYGFLENSLNKILELGQKDITLSNVKRVLTISNNGKERFFFFILNKNKEIIEAYREKILSAEDVNELYYYCKYYCQLIIDSNDVNEYDDKIPKYLFKEKILLIDVFKKYNQKKKKLLLSLLSKTEKALRKEGGVSLIMGLRFILHIKKITIS